ncbi:quinone oxidoreductase, partial [Staphylococcus aureus]
ASTGNQDVNRHLLEISFKDAFDRLPVDDDHKKQLSCSSWQACLDSVGDEGITNVSKCLYYNV